MPKVKQSRAKRVKKKIAEQVTKRPIPDEPTYHDIPKPTEEEVARVDAILEKRIAESTLDDTREQELRLEGLGTEAVATRLEEESFADKTWDTLTAFADEQQRFEEYEYFGEPGIIDHHTGFVARFGHRDSRDGMLSAANLIDDDPTFVDGLDWTHLPSGSRVYLTHHTESNRYFALDHPDMGLAVLDRFTQMVVPVEDDTTAVAFDMLLQNINDDDGLGQRMFSAEGVSVDDWMRWLQVGGGIDVPDEPTDMKWENEDKGSPVKEAVQATEPAGRPLRILIISSSAWSWGGLVDQHIGSLVARSGDQNRPVSIVTSGSPNGAEAGARALAAANGWYTETIRDEGIPHGDIDYGFAYISNQSAGAEAALEIALGARIPVHVTRETSAVVIDAWAGR